MRESGCVHGEEQEKLIRRNDSSDYVIRAKGQRVRLWLNSQRTVDYTGPDAAIPQEGVFGLQIHKGAASEAWYKDIAIQVLPGNPGVPPSVSYRESPLGIVPRFKPPQLHRSGSAAGRAHRRTTGQNTR